MPAGGALELVPPHEIRAAAFCDRREIGIVCLSGIRASSSPTVEELALDAEDIAYVGQGTKSRRRRRATPCST